MAPESRVHSTRIFYVDPETELHGVVSSLLTAEDRAVRCFATSEEALQDLAAGADEPALVIADLRLPGSTVTDFVRKVRATRPFARIIITGPTTDKAAALSVPDLRQTFFVEKPFDRGLLLEAVERCAERREGPDPALIPRDDVPPGQKGVLPAESEEAARRERQQLEAALAAQKTVFGKRMRQLESDFLTRKASMDKELREMWQKAEAEIFGRKAALENEILQIKTDVEERRMQSEDLMARALDAIRDRDDTVDTLARRVKGLESENLQLREMAEKTSAEIDGIKNALDLALRSREALLSEIAQLKNRN